MDAEGKYHTNYESEGKRFAIQMASLSSGRVFIGAGGTMSVFYTLGIALRHSLMRRQFADAPN